MDELTEVKRMAEAKLVAYENWDAEAAKYQLTDHGGGQLVMTLKNPQQDSAPSHWLCPNCFQKKEKSYLSRESLRKIDFKCIRCGYSVCIEDAPTVRLFPPKVNR
jgi:rubredoxin